MSITDPNNPNQTDGGLKMNENSYNIHDANVYPYSYNLKIMTYSGSYVTQIDFYSGASSFSTTGSLEFSHKFKYDGANPTHMLILNS